MAVVIAVEITTLQSDRDHSEVILHLLAFTSLKMR